jgi:class 3 adenylate cyclase/tetratricopeptide (TPR) repeat protein
MELLADRDPEEARKLLDPVLERMMEAVHRYEGTVNQVMGDGIMALFGAPLAHEDHAVRACYAALRMQETVKRYAEGVRRTEGLPLQIRVGLNSGEVVVRSIGSDLHMDYTAVGQTTHVAARMEQMALPGTILLSAETLALAEGYIEVKALGPLPVKGLETPIEVYELTGATTVRSRFQAAAARGLTQFVGRESELEQLRQALERARAGHGQVVAVVGEPGVGKSRLFREFTHSHHAQGWLVLESGSVSYGKATNYLPTLELLRAYFQIEQADDARKIREKVTGKLLSLDRQLEPSVSPILWLLDVPVEDESWERLDPPQRRQRVLDGVKRLLLRESQVQPLMVLFEDLHWIDAESQALLDSLVESLPTARLLLLVNYRPEYQHGWGSKTYYRQFQIEPLPPESAEALLDALLGSDAALAPLKRLVIERTEGNPFFIEETVRSLVETGILAGERGAYRLTRMVQGLQVPATAQAMLAARIDRLAPEDKRLLQAAAVIGTDVPFALLQAVADEPEERLRRGLAQLQTTEFLYETRLFPDLEYTFRHALTHEVAYSTLLSERRCALHTRIVEAIEALYPDRLAEHVERLAHHALRGKLHDKAVAYLRQAGDRAAARSASHEAVALFEQAVAILGELPDTPQALGVAADVHIGLATALIPIKGTGSADVEESCLRARELAERLDDPTRLYQALWGLWFVNFGRGRYASARELGELLLAIAERGDDTGRLLQAHHALWPTLTAMGESIAAQRHLERGLALYDPEQHASQAFLYGGHDAGACCRYHLGRTQWVLGYPERAVAATRDAVVLAERLGHPLTMVIGLSAAASLHYQLGDTRSARESAERMVTVAKAHRFTAWLEDGLVILAAVAARERGDRQGIEEVSRRLDAAKTGSTAMRMVVNRILVAEASCEAGDVERGLRALEVIPAEQRDTILAPEIRRLRGELHLHRHEWEDAARCFRGAIAIARQRSERMLELRATTSLARLLAIQGRREEARRALEEIYAWFTEGFDTADLRNARAVLSQLS